jgi:hypothetical protein
MAQFAEQTLHGAYCDADEDVREKAVVDPVPGEPENQIEVSHGGKGSVASEPGWYQ